MKVFFFLKKKVINGLEINVILVFFLEGNRGERSNFQFKKKSTKQIFNCTLQSVHYKK